MLIKAGKMTSHKNGQISIHKFIPLLPTHNDYHWILDSFDSSATQKLAKLDF